MKFTGPGGLVRVCVMLKKIALVVLAVLTLSGGFVAVKFIIPMYTVLDKVGPEVHRATSHCRMTVGSKCHLVTRIRR